VSTDNGATWNSIYTPTDVASSGWEEIVADISKYAGNVVRFRFSYSLFAFTSSPRPGWMLDDLSVDMSTVPITEVRVTNNLAQAAFTLRGPTNGVFAGVGMHFHTNAPPGVYVIAWESVPFYVTPASQTNTLGASAPLVFHGNYTYPDLNGNGISDLWEQYYFGQVASSHPPGQDSDGDGASDWDEFIAGTDPTKAQSRLQLTGPLTQPNHTVRFEWPSAPGRAYQLEVSNDLDHWQAVTDAQRGDGEMLGATLPALDPRLAYFFRVQVTP
jgi:hypothetical protein